MTTIMQVPFFRPFIGEDEIDEVVSSLKSGWLTTGPKTAQFEVDFANAIGGDVEAVALNSATAALHLALEAIGITQGDEVICPTLTFTATAEVVRYLGADPVFVDSELSTGNIRAENIEKAITERTKAIIPVHYAGLPCDMAAILEVANRYGLDVVEDAAHAFPAVSGGRVVGNTGSKATAFSFYANKTMTTGEGGMLVTPDRDLARRAREMRLHGINRDVFDRFNSVKAPWRYDVVAPGYKYNMTDIAASLGIHQLKRAKGFAVDRSAQAQRYIEAFADLPLYLPAEAPENYEHSWHLFVLRLKDEAHINRDGLVEGMQKAGIGVSVHYTPLHMLTYWSESYDLKPEDFPVAKNFFDHCISIPLFQGMRSDEQNYVIQTIRKLLG